MCSLSPNMSLRSTASKSPFGRSQANCPTLFLKVQGERRISLDPTNGPGARQKSEINVTRLCQGFVQQRRAPWLHDIRRTIATRMGDIGVLPHVAVTPLAGMQQLPRRIQDSSREDIDEAL